MDAYTNIDLISILIVLFGICLLGTLCAFAEFIKGYVFIKENNHKVRMLVRSLSAGCFMFFILFAVGGFLLLLKYTQGS